MVVFTSKTPQHMGLGWHVRNVQLYYNCFKYKSRSDELSLRYGKKYGTT